MKKRYSLVCRGLRGGTFYCYDSLTKKRSSLGTTDTDDAEQIVQAKNQALRQPALNLHIAKAYLAGTDSGITTRTWQHALNALIETKSGSTKERWSRAAKERALDLIRGRLIVETQAEHFLAVLNAGTVSTNVHLRKLHNFALDMNWLPWPVIPKRRWPAIEFGKKRAITFEEHQKIMAQEQNAERRAFYELAWHLGAAQSDIANLVAEDVDWSDGVIAFSRKKTDTVSMVHVGDKLAAVLGTLPKAGLLFPNFAKLAAGHRSTEFARACRRAEVSGVTLHCYRYAWAERAKTVGMPERFAQQALGHNSAAVHRAYSKKALVKIPSLEEYERKIIHLRRTVNQ